MSFKRFFFFFSVCLISLMANAQVYIEFPEQNDPLAPDSIQTADSPQLPDSLFTKDHLDSFYADEVYMPNDSTVAMSVAVVLSDIYSKKDMEFTRGFLMGMSQADLPRNSISLKIINGEIPADSLDYELNQFSPDVIISTFEKDSPVSLRTYARNHGSSLINVFDAKGDDYRYNQNVIQLLAPSDKFNSSVTRYMLDNLKNAVLVLVGDPDPTDSSVRDLILEWSEDDLMILSPDDLSLFILEEGTDYLFYPLVSGSDEIKDVLGRISKMMTETPTAGIKVMGRPNWIAINDLNTWIANMEVFVPEKCYFDPTKESGKKFIGSYNSIYGHAPIRSYPVYSVMGYDGARYFLPRLFAKHNGQEMEWDPQNMTQSYFDMEQSKGGGLYNKGGFLLHYEPWGTMSKETIGN